MENYKQKYEAAIKQAKKELEACGSLDCDAARQIFRLFPELQSIKNERIKTNIIKLLRFVRDTYHQYSDECNEAIEWLKKQSDAIICLEDNWIREELIHFLETCQDTRFVGNRKRDKWIEWLEKQNKPQVRTGNEWVNTVDNACNHRYAEEYAHGEYCHEQSFKWGFQEGVDWLEKHPIFAMPKIEFKVGDWVIYKDGTPKSVYKVEKIENYEYTLRHTLGGSMPLPFSSENLIRPWTIQDAKDGDVLATKDAVFIFKHMDKAGLSLCKSYCEVIGDSKLGLGFDFSVDSVHPAAKEERDILFQKIKEAGYDWDSDKKRIN